MPATREGSACDADVGEPGCAVCEAGTECLADPRDLGARVCLRPCDTEENCVCPSADPNALDTCQMMLPEPDETLSCGPFQPPPWHEQSCNGVLCWAASDFDSTTPPSGASACQ